MNKTTVAEIYEGKLLIDVNHHSRDVFDADVIIISLTHNDDGTPRALESFLEQETTLKTALLIIDDGTSTLEMGGDERILCAKIPSVSVAIARNLGNTIAKRLFSPDAWVARLDADDTFADPNTIQSIYDSIDHTKEWALAGNTLSENHERIERVNKVDETLMIPETLINRLKHMSLGDKSAELPSCNLWKKNSLKAVYPDTSSAEDHYLVSQLLLKSRQNGQILTGKFHACYDLTGHLSNSNQKSGQHRESREKLYHFMAETDPESELLGWGSEGMVTRRGELIEKVFHSPIFTDEHAQWLGELPNTLPMPKYDFNLIEGKWVATTHSVTVQTPETVTRTQLSNFIQSCLSHNIVFLNVNRDNMALFKGQLIMLDVGSQIVPFEARFFRDMCVRLYLSYVQNLSDREVSSRTYAFRNNIEAMNQIEGFEDFYAREVQLHSRENSYFRKKPRDIAAPVRHHEDTTLLVKTCGMDHTILEQQVHHIINQITQWDSFTSRLLVIDPKVGDYLRRWNEGDLQNLLVTAKQLKDEGWIDDFLISPNEDKELVTQVLERWFSKSSVETHNVQGVPLFPQLWGFEQVPTQYMFQMDADVIFARSEDDNVIQEMKNALQADQVFGVGFNIPQPEGRELLRYGGSYVPEVRCGFFDISRMKSQAPYPNVISGDGKLEISWYRSIEDYQNQTGWKCLRGGRSSSVYLHPMNSMKGDVRFHDRVMDLMEQNIIPEEQLGLWDVVEDATIWKYPSRPEEVVFTLHCSQPIEHFTRALLRSIENQELESIGVVIFCDDSTTARRDWLLTLEEEFRGRITFVRKRWSRFDSKEILAMLKEICIHENPLILEMESHEILMNSLSTTQLTLATGDLYTCDYIAARPLGIREANGPYTPVYELAYKKRGWRMNKNSGEATFSGSYFAINHNMEFRSSGDSRLRKTIYIPNLKKLEIDITYFCNLTCSGCSRSSAQAPSNQHMSLDQIQEFLDETDRKGHKWESIHLLGGEPTLHPQFVELVTMLDDWFQVHSPDTELKVITNGVSKKTRLNLQKIPERWHYSNSFKFDRQSATKHFEPFNMAPEDLEEWKDEDFTKGCYNTQDSGIGLTPYGYHHCALAGGIQRIFGGSDGFVEIPNHPWDFLELMEEYCGKCGHFMSDVPLERQARSAMNVDPGEQSKSWQLAYEKWRVNGDA
jgi:uncharacterized radical SAM superfamily Fe-S cluster-containing enzyme/glycosyltransferase involved in cell wall biosynthesis